MASCFPISICELYEKRMPGLGDAERALLMRRGGWEGRGEAEQANCSECYGLVFQFHLKATPNVRLT